MFSFSMLHSGGPPITITAKRKPSNDVQGYGWERKRKGPSQ